MVKPLFIGFVFLTAALAVNGQISPPEKTLTKARYLVSEKKYTEALAALENVKSNSPDPMQAALSMGQALSGLGQFGEAEKWLLQVNGEGAAEAFYLLAKNSLSVNDWKSAILYLGKHLGDKNHFPEKQIRLDPGFSKLENDREWIHLWQTDWYSISEKQAAEGEYLLSLGQNDESRILVSQLIANQPNEPRAWYLLARINWLQKEDRQFRQSLEKAWQLSSGDLHLRGKLLQLAFESGYLEKVNDMASELIRSDPTNPDYQITRSLARILDGKESLAVKEIQAAEETGISPAELFYQAGRKISSTMTQQAEIYLSKAIDSEILDSRFYYARGMVRIKLDKIDLGLGDFAMSLDIDPNQPDLYFNRAQVRLDLGDSEGACHDWKLAVGMGHVQAVDQLYKYCRLP